MVGAPRRGYRVKVALVQGTGGLLTLFGAAILLGGPGAAHAGAGLQSATGPAEQVTSPSPPPASPSAPESSRWPSSAPQADATSETVAASQPDSAEIARQRQLQVFGPILLNPSRDIDAETRRNAAQELLNMHSADSSELLKNAIASR